MYYSFKSEIHYRNKGITRTIYTKGNMRKIKDIKAGMVVELQGSKQKQTKPVYGIVLTNRNGKKKIYRTDGSNGIFIDNYNEDGTRNSPYSYLTITRVLPYKSITSGLQMFSYIQSYGKLPPMPYIDGVEWVLMNGKVPVVIDGETVYISAESARALKGALNGMKL